jgi:hypothetical protein
MVQFVKEFEDVCFKKFENDSKIGILSSVSPEGYPHMAFISSLGVKTKTSLMWGQFSLGLSKTYLKENKKTGFLVISADQYWWTGKALHTGTVVKGEDFDYFNNKPLFRYNSYCGFGAVHYGGIVDVSLGQKLPILKVALGSCASALMKGKARKRAAGSAGSGASGNAVQKMPGYGVKLCSNMTTLKFIAYIDSDGFPRIIPALQGTPVDPNRLVFSSLPYGEMLRQIPPGAKAAVFLTNLDLESILLQGRWNPLKKGGVFEIDKVYNSMLPLNRYVYPPTELPNVYGEKGVWGLA